MKLTQEQIDFRYLWMDALHSGEYKQARGKLRKAEGFCCLGVACDLVDSTKWTEMGFCQSYEGKENSPPQQIKSLIGINLFDEYELIKMNDTLRCTFEEIAETIHLITLADMEE